jgi:hypothetical protein
MNMAVTNQLKHVPAVCPGNVYVNSKVCYKQHQLLHWDRLLMYTEKHIKPKTISYLFGATCLSQRVVYGWINLEYFDSFFVPVRISVNNLYK